MSIENTVSNRIEWVDIAKGIAIILVIIGHTVTGPFRGLIFSFHMPLFFVMSAVTYKVSKDNDEFVRKAEKSFKHIIIPAICIFVIRTIIQICSNVSLIHGYEAIREYVRELMLVCSYSSGVCVDVKGTIIDPLGMPWFLVVFFLSRILYDYINLKTSKKWVAIIAIILGIIGVAIEGIQWLPFSLDLVMAVMPFYVFGSNIYKLKIDKNPFAKMVISTVAWIGIFGFIYKLEEGAYLEIASRDYPLFPLCHLDALCGIMAVSGISVLIAKVPCGTKTIMCVGKNSLYLFCVHMLDYSFEKIWLLTQNEYINSIIRVAEDLILLFIILKIKDFIMRKKYESN